MLVPINKLLLLLAGVLVGLAVFFQWNIATTSAHNSGLETEYQRALNAHKENNIYYTPQTTVQWILSRQNPNGYFVANPDMLFEPSQLNDSTLRGTRYAISTIRDLEGMDTINRKAVGEFVLSLYEPDIKRVNMTRPSRYQHNEKYAGFRTQADEEVGVRPTMDALITLDALGLLSDPRINLDRIWNFITAHQNPDGGFWDEHYPKLGTDSSMKCTSFAARALGILHRHTQRSYPESLITGIRQYVEASLDPDTGGYRGQPGKQATDSYNAFRAFISIWNTTEGTDETKIKAVRETIDMERLVKYFRQQHYLSERGAYSRYSTPEKKKPSIKATHLIIWLMYKMQLLDHVDTRELSRYVMSLRAVDGQYGGDIYTTYSAIGLLQKMGIPTTPLPAPEKPEKTATIPGYVPTIFYLAALVTLAIGYQAKKFELETINKALSLQANIDGLTGIYNRQRFETMLQHEMQKAKRYQRPLALIMFDVDDFKLINDNYGHYAGDNILKSITKLVKDALRDSDVFARWGGEEFIILSPETSLSGVQQLAEKLRLILEQAHFDENIQVTASFGVSELQKADNMETLVRRADNAMLQAKRLGKNQIYTEAINQQLPETLTTIR